MSKGNIRSAATFAKIEEAYLHRVDNHFLYNLSLTFTQVKVPRVSFQREKSFKCIVYIGSMLVDLTFLWFATLTTASCNSPRKISNFKFSESLVLFNFCFIASRSSLHVAWLLLITSTSWRITSRQSRTYDSKPSSSVATFCFSPFFYSLMATKTTITCSEKVHSTTKITKQLAHISSAQLSSVHYRCDSVLCSPVLVPVLSVPPNTGH